MHLYRIESLEERRLLSVTIDNAGLVSVQGTDAPDQITIALKTEPAQDPNSTPNTNVVITVNGTETSYNVGSVTGIQVDGGAGRDSIVVDPSGGALNIPVTMLGGGGKDSLTGGSGSDSLAGGNGKDSLTGEDGSDSLCGGNGKDCLDGGAGDDSLDGGRGKDKMIAVGDTDTVVDTDNGHGKDQGNDKQHGPPANVGDHSGQSDGDQNDNEQHDDSLSGSDSSQSLLD